MKKLSSFIRSYKFYTLAIFAIFIFLFTQNYLVSVLAQKYLKELDIKYSKIEGSLLDGISLHDIKYTDAIRIKKLQINYNFLYLLRSSPKISKIKIKDLYLDLSKLPASDENASATSFISFGVANIELDNTKVISSNETLEFNLKAKEFHYNGEVDIESLALDLKSSYANALLKGSVQGNKFIGESSVEISQSTSKEYLSFLKEVPKTFYVKIEATQQKALLSTELEKLSLEGEENLILKDANIMLTYFVDDNSLEANASYKASYLEFESVLTQTFLLSSEQKYSSKLKANITKSSIEFPFENIEADVLGDKNTMLANIQAGSSNCTLSSQDYKSFVVKLDDAYVKAQGNLELKTNEEIFQALISPQLKNEFYKDYPVALVSPIKILYKNNPKASDLKIDANLFHASLSKEENTLKGRGTLGSSSFSVSGKLEQSSEIKIFTKIPSINKLLSELQLTPKDSKTFHKGEVEIDSTLHFAQIFSMKNDIRMPSYTLETDTKKSDTLEDIFLSTTYMNKQLTIHNYKAKYMDEELYSNKPSTFLLDDTTNIIIKDFWFHENLHASGFIDTSTNKLDIAIKSDAFSYAFKETNVSVQTDLQVSINPSGIQKIKGNIALLNLALNKEAVKLPFKKINANISGNTKGVTIKLQAGPIDFYASSKDYEYFTIQAEQKNLSLAFLDFLPEQLKKDKVSFTTKADMHISPFSIKAKFKADDEYLTLDAQVSLEQNTILSSATLHAKLENELYEKYPLKLFSPMKIDYKKIPSSEEIHIDANLLHATLLRNNSYINGFGTLGSSKFTLSTQTDKNKDTIISLNTKTPSIDTLLSELQLTKEGEDSILHDGEVDINSTIVLGDTLLIKNDIFMPWYTITQDSESKYLVENIVLSTEYKDKTFTLNTYEAKYMQHKFYADKPSTFIMDANQTIQIKEFWIFDNLLTSGFLNTSKNTLNLHIKSDKFRYEGEDANLSAKADLYVNMDFFGKQKIQGTITLLDGVISYEPPQDYVITDQDIIVAQDVKTNYNENRFIDVSIHSLHPISYKTKDIDIKVTPNIAVHQEFNKPLKLLGMLTVNEGKITTGDKEFVFDTSEVYFSGEDPINPQLNLNLHYYTLDYIDIEIFITNTLSSPIVIFSSKPAMSQNDIMSYILFGEPASSLFESSDGSTKVSVSSLLLGTGLKQMFNDTTGVKVNTFNILSNKEGTLGYEIGTNFTKKIRILYRSDTVSSVILQYSLSKSIRIDVDVDQSGQGVNIIYVKDF